MVIEKKIKPEIENLLCYNCGIEIIDKTQKYCPNCDVILNPNGYIHWKVSFYSFMCLLCIIPLMIMVISLLM